MKFFELMSLSAAHAYICPTFNFTIHMKLWCRTCREQHSQISLLRGTKMKGATVLLKMLEEAVSCVEHPRQHTHSHMADHVSLTDLKPTVLLT